MRLFAFACVRLHSFASTVRDRRTYIHVDKVFGMALLALIFYTRVCIVRPFICANCVRVYRTCRSGFDCVVKRLRMALYKPDCDFNDCELPSGQYNYY